MSQLTIYLPEDLHEKVRKKSKELGISLSSYMASLVSEAFESDTMSELDALFGSCEGLSEAQDAPPEPFDF